MQEKTLALVCLAAVLLLSMLPNMAWVVSAGGGDQAAWRALSLGALVLLGGYAVLGQSCLVVAVLALPVSLVPFEVFYILKYSRPSDALLLGVLAESPPAEALEFLGRDLALVFFSAEFFILFLLAYTYLLCRRVDLRWRGHSRRLCQFLIVLLLGWVGGLEIAASERERTVSLQGDHALMDRVRLPLLADLETSFPAGPLMRLQSYYRERTVLASLQRQRQDFRFFAHSGHGASLREIYVLILGETGRPDRLGLNGYVRDTTPRLSAEEGVVSFRDVVSSWAWTRMSVPVLVSRKQPDDHRDYFSEPGLVTAFKEAGFKTYWISTQSPLGLQDSSISAFAREADEVRFMNPADYMLPGVYDGVLLNELDKIIARGEGKQLVVLHTLGGHFNYADRYPAEFDVFQPSLKGVSVSLRDRSQKLRMNNSYDNSVLYLDYLVSSVIDRLRESSAVSALLYVADHGENLFDGDCGKSGHGGNTEFDYRVPALWWGSLKYREYFPEVERQAQRHTNSPLGSYNIFHSFLDMSGVEYPQQELSKSLFSTYWRAFPRPTQSNLDFDSSGRDPVCRTLEVKER